MRSTVLFTAALLSLAALTTPTTGVRAATPISLTGRWAGTERIAVRRQNVPLDFQLLENSVGAFSGNGTLGADLNLNATLTGALGGHHKLKAELKDETGGDFIITGRLNPQTGTISGRFHGRQGDGQHAHGTFVLRKQIQ